MNVNLLLIAQAKKLLLMQLSVSTLVSIVIFFSTINYWTASSVFVGGIVAMMISLMLQWDFWRAEKVAEHDIKRSAAILYIGAVQRFFMVIALFAICIFLLKTNPLFTVIGFAIAQLCYWTLAKSPDIANQTGKQKTS